MLKKINILNLGKDYNANRLNLGNIFLIYSLLSILK